MEKNQYDLCALHKLLISGRRHSDKAERDRVQAVAVMRALRAAGQDVRLRTVFAALPVKWKAQIMRGIELSGEDGVSALLASTLWN